jgi:copper(I)-binding protein
MMTTTLWGVAVFEEDRVTRSHRRLAAPAVAAALALSTGVLAACGAGQLAATSLVVPAVAGAQVSVAAGSPTETITIANATVRYPGPEGYPQGGTAQVSVWLFNNTSKDITLDGVRSPFGQVLLAPGAQRAAVSPCLTSARPIQPNPSTGAPTAGVGASAGASAGVATPGPTGTPSTHTSVPPTGAAAPSGSASPTPTPAPAGSAPAGSATVSVPVKAFGCVALTPDSAQFLLVTELSQAVGSGRTVPMEFHFTQAGGASYTIGEPDLVQVPIDVPTAAASRAAAVVTPKGE